MDKLNIEKRCNSHVKDIIVCVIKLFISFDNCFSFIDKELKHEVKITNDINAFVIFILHMK